MTHALVLLLGSPVADGEGKEGMRRCVVSRRKDMDSTRLSNECLTAMRQQEQCIGSILKHFKKFWRETRGDERQELVKHFAAMIAFTKRQSMHALPLSLFLSLLPPSCQPATTGSLSRSAHAACCLMSRNRSTRGEAEGRERRRSRPCVLGRQDEWRQNWLRSVSRGIC